jgi:hypothetical protein
MSLTGGHLADSLTMKMKGNASGMARQSGRMCVSLISDMDAQMIILWNE